MRSPRRRFEIACRLAAFAALGWLLGESLFPAASRRVERATTGNVASRLGAWTRAGSNVALHGTFATAPATWVVDWLGALSRSGVPVTWSGSPPPAAITAEALADPAGGTRIAVAAPAKSLLVLRDDAGVLDSVRVADLGASVTAPLVAGSVHALANGQQLDTPLPPQPGLRAVVVIGRASWEGRFIASALEERGWSVIARFVVAPNVQVGQSAPLVLDTSRVAAVVAVDSTVGALEPGLTRFVKSGGGLVLVGSAALPKSDSALAPGVPAARVRPAILPADTIGLGSTGFFPVRLGRDAVALERRPEGVSIAARRSGAGRVIQVGYDDSWRWRLAGGPGSERAHRTWWAHIVAAVAYVPTDLDGAAALPESAPLAHLVDRLGPAQPATAAAPRSPLDRRILVILIMILLLTEWGSRRLRGLR
jgi:hypothetical protein